jgi:hypothetical protein
MLMFESNLNLEVLLRLLWERGADGRRVSPRQPALV